VNAEACAALLPIQSLCVSSAKKAGIPDERHYDGTSIEKVDSDSVIREADMTNSFAGVRLGSIHTMFPEA